MTASITAVRGWTRSRKALPVVLVLLAVALVWSVLARGSSAAAARGYRVPQDAKVESTLGVRFSQAAVVADGGIVELRYVVLDPQKASRFQNDVHHPPVLRSERRGGSVYRTALMKQGHDLRPGQTYYVLYLNNHAAIRSGESMEIDAGGGRIASVPVR